MNLLSDSEAASRVDAGGTADVAQALADTCRCSGLSPLRLHGLELLPVVQGGMGMGVGVSAHRLAGSVAALGPRARFRRSTCAAITPI